MATTTITPTPAEDLRKSLENHNNTFTTLLSLIPAQYYIAPDPEVVDSKWMKNKKRKSGEEIKEHKRKVKHDKLDPSNHKTLDQIQSIDSETNGTVSNEIVEAGPSNPPPSTSSNAIALKPLAPSASISDLRAKLQSRLDNFKRQRGVTDDYINNQNGNGNGNPNGDDAYSRNALEEERRRKRGEMRDKRRNLRKEERRKEGEKGKPTKTQLIVPQPREDHSSSLSFPSLSLPSSNKTKTNKSSLKQLSNPAQALAHLEKHNAHLASLPEDRRKEIEERERWAKAEERASGVKIADSENVLKKAVKRKEKAKTKSSQQWSERKREIEKSATVAAKKRNDNIAKRVDDKRNKRLGIKDKGTGAKKGKARPGFEGKKGKGGGKK
ncbi:uncharacterized protein IL334_007494 [Kwoniella shivajii]|uniref:Ribosomal RNA-processing protein 14/surfeit locus protein 6 C-terminal domain-containing protein n=1 Tax=Kwoniella shivajii TaxID=564305 RepID=A0ABZ1D8U1_9TREE|nr:hypothetical protein IL334_007494 [Kwoniella shivajii]